MKMPLKGCITFHLEFLIGRMLRNSALNLGINDKLKAAMEALGRDLENAG